MKYYYPRDFLSLPREFKYPYYTLLPWQFNSIAADLSSDHFLNDFQSLFTSVAFTDAGSADQSRGDYANLGGAGGKMTEDIFTAFRTIMMLFNNKTNGTTAISDSISDEFTLIAHPIFLHGKPLVVLTFVSFFSILTLVL